MRFAALTPDGERDAGWCHFTYFGIPAGREAEAARDLLDAMSAGFEVQLQNDRDEGREGVTFFRRTAIGLTTRAGGHGWQGEWGPIDEAAFTAAVAELADRNRGGHWSTQGALARY